MFVKLTPECFPLTYFDQEYLISPWKIKHKQNALQTIKYTFVESSTIIHLLENKCTGGRSNVRPESRPLFTIANAETFELIYSHEKKQGYHLSVVIVKMWGVQLRSNQGRILSKKVSF